MFLLCDYLGIPEYNHADPWVLIRESAMYLHLAQQSEQFFAGVPFHFVVIYIIIPGLIAVGHKFGLWKDSPLLMPLLRGPKMGGGGGVHFIFVYSSRSPSGKYHLLGGTSDSQSELILLYWYWYE